MDRPAEKNKAFLIAAGLAVFLGGIFLFQVCIATSQTNGYVFPEPKLNPNTATAQELMMIDGIGPEKAGRIIEYREKLPLGSRAFENYKDLQKVPGIGPKTAEKLKDVFEF